MTLTKCVRASATLLGALLVTTQVNAADLYSGGGFKDAPAYVAPAPMWTGFYLGGHLGADWASLKTGRNVWDDGHVNSTGVHDTVEAFGGERLASTGAFAGGQLGYNWQISSLLLGFEADLGGVGNKNERTYSLTGLNATSHALTRAATITLKNEGGFYGDVTGRLGLTWGPVLFYGKGGYAWLNTNFKASGEIVDGTVTPATITTTSRTHNMTLNGWTAGGGIEYMLSNSWTMKVEYLHYDFTNAADTWAFDARNTWELTGKNLNVDTAKLGFNYIFNSSHTPLK